VSNIDDIPDNVNELLMNKPDVPQNGRFLTSKDIGMIYEAWQEHLTKFPQTPPDVSLKYIMMNIGNQWAPIVCVRGEWRGTILDVKEIKEDGRQPVCPNGHGLTRGPGLRLSWSQKDYGSVDDDESNCDVWMRVDFGHGPVEVRCTQTGEHEEHACAVSFEKADA
jgi:hypothetical protein